MLSKAIGALGNAVQNLKSKDVKWPHRSKIKWRVAVLLVLVSLLLTTMAGASTPPPTLATDKPDYFSGETVHITGTGFVPGNYALPVKRPDGSIVKGDGSSTPGWDIVTADASGRLAYDYQLDGIYGSYEARAYLAGWSGDWNETPIASVTFTDADIHFTQCQNDSDNNNAVDDCEWGTGALTQNNSIYTEGDAVPQRLFHKIDTAGTHTMRLEYDFSKANIYAYDFLTNVDDTQSGALLNQCGNLPGFVTSGTCSTIFSGAALAGIPSDPFDAVAARETPTTRNIRVGCSPACIVPPVVTVSFPSLDGLDDPGEAHLPDTDPDCFQTCGTSSVQIEITFASLADTLVGVWFGGHLAASFDPPGPAIGWGTGFGASSISGAPFHLQYISLDGGSVGQRDNQLQPGAVVPPPQLIVIKHVVNDNGGTAVASDFTMSVSGSAVFGGSTSFPGAESPGTMVVLNEGSYSVTETGPSGYAQSNSADCSGTILKGQTKTCTVTNDDIQPKLIVIKHVVNDNGGTAVAADFTLSVTGNNASPASFRGEEAPGTMVALDAGAYSVGESSVFGYTSDGGSADCSGSIAVGETKTCTFTNDDIQPKLIVIKHVVNDNGGTATASQFTMNVTGNSPSPATFPGAESPGTTVMLNAGAYSVSETGPAGYSASFSADCSGSIAVGQTKTCMVTNDDIQPKLIVIKHVVNDNGGTAVASDFTMSVTGNSPSPATFPGAESPGTTVMLNAGAYSVSETGPSGYAQSNSPDCSGSIAVGETKTCTVTNDDIQPKLIVIKHVVNDNGGTAVAGDFTMSVTGNSPSPASFPGAESPGTTVMLNAGAYSVSETGPSSYSASFSADCSASISVGETKTCTVTNDDIQPKLIVIKHVVNDNGGTAVAGDFTMSVTGNSPSPASFPGAEAPGTTVMLNAGAYSVSETGPSGYSASFSADCAGSIAVGQTKTCTVTNDDIQPKLIVIKHVINDNGGTATASQFTMNVTGNSPSPATFPGAEAPGTTVMLNAGSYSVSETGPSGYSASFSADCAGSIAVGQTKTCTVTNDDVQPKLIVIKHVVNDNGGTATASQFTMNVTGNSPSPATFPGAESPGTTVMLNAGSYSVSETGPSGYSASFSADCSASISVGETKTCTVTNDDVQPKLIVIKHVINDNGGTATAANFTMMVTGNSPSPASFAGQESPGTTVMLNAGSYSVSETGPSGYSASFSADCSASISVGETKTCTVTNDDVQPKLIVIKHVINDNGGAAVASDFTMNVTGNSPSPASFPGAESPGTTVMLDAGAYSVSETGPAGYTASFSADCSGSIAVGQTKTCTVTNDDIPKPPIKVTGGGQIPVPDPTSSGRASFGFIAQRKVTGGPATGHFNYLNHVTGLHVNGPVNDIQVIATNPDGSPKTVQFSGTCDGSLPACSFTVTVEDHGEPGRFDEFGIVVTGGLTETRSQRVISRGNIQFHTQ